MIRNSSSSFCSRSSCDSFNMMASLHSNWCIRSSSASCLLFSRVCIPIVPLEFVWCRQVCQESNSERARTSIIEAPNMREKCREKKELSSNRSTRIKCDEKCLFQNKWTERNRTVHKSTHEWKIISFRIQWFFSDALANIKFARGSNRCCCNELKNKQHTQSLQRKQSKKSELRIEVYEHHRRSIFVYIWLLNICFERLTKINKINTSSCHVDQGLEEGCEGSTIAWLRLRKKWICRAFDLWFRWLLHNVFYSFYSRLAVFIPRCLFYFQVLFVSNVLEPIDLPFAILFRARVFALRPLWFHNSKIDSPLWSVRTLFASSRALWSLSAAAWCFVDFFSRIRCMKIPREEKRRKWKEKQRLRISLFSKREKEWKIRKERRRKQKISLLSFAKYVPTTMKAKKPSGKCFEGIKKTQFDVHRFFHCRCFPIP